ncbi:MAG: PilN domain-containing protein [Parvibaculaceae bacterium]
MLRSWALGLLRFWTWWTGELRSLLVRKSSVRTPGYRSYCELHLHDGLLEITDISCGAERDDRTFRGILSLESGGDPPRLLARRNLPFILSLPVENCFLHRVEVPKAALSRIDQLLALELVRVTPFLAADVLSGWYDTGETPSETHTTVAQVVAKRSILGPVLADLTRREVPVAGIFARTTEGDFLPATLGNPEIAIDDRGVGRWRKLALAACGFAGLCVAAAAWNLFSQQAAELAELSQRIEIVQKKAVAVRKRLDQMESSSQRIIDLKTAKLQGPSPLAIWEELTRLIPDTAWLSALSIEKAQVTIEGNARSPEELIPLLDGSALFEAVSFAAPVTKLPGNDMTRFVIRLSLSRNVQVSSAAP